MSKCKCHENCHIRPAQNPRNENLPSITYESNFMSFLRRIMFALWYFRRPPWDSGVTPPELREFLRVRPVGRAIDLGCGTGTNSIVMAQLGWQVTGVDFIPAAIQKARNKARQAGLNLTLLVGDVTRLDGITGPFELVLDLGCYHTLMVKEKAAYLRQLDRVMVSGSVWFLYGFLSSDENISDLGLSPGDLERIQAQFVLLTRLDGYDRGDRPSAYFVFQKRNNPTP